MGVRCTAQARQAPSSPQRISASGLCESSPHARGEWRAERRRPMVSVSVAGHGGRLSARHARSCSEAIAQHKHLRRSHSAGPRFLSEQRKHAPYISQLLAGTRIGPGRSPGAARVNDLRDQTRGRRASSRLSFASRSALQSDEVMRMVMEVGSAGISLFRPAR